MDSELFYISTSLRCAPRMSRDRQYDVSLSVPPKGMPMAKGILAVQCGEIMNEVEDFLRSCKACG